MMTGAIYAVTAFMCCAASILHTEPVARYGCPLHILLEKELLT